MYCCCDDAVGGDIGGPSQRYMPPPAGSGCGGYQRLDGILFSLEVGRWTVTGGERSLRARWLLMTQWRKTVE
jgi:hypothetical protein